MAKLFLGGLPTDVTTPVVQEYFSQFGTVIDAVAIGGRGFGFVTFDSEATAADVLNIGEHIIGGKPIDVKDATVEGTKGANGSKGKFGLDKGKGGFVNFNGGGMGQGQVGMNMGMKGGGGGGAPMGKGGGGGGGMMGGDAGSSQLSRSGKIFVGGLPKDTDEEMLIAHFSTYGTIVDTVVMKDRNTGAPRGFGFVTFNPVEAADHVMAEFDNHQIGGKWVECKLADGQDRIATAANPGRRDGLQRSMIMAGKGGCQGDPQQELMRLQAQFGSNMASGCQGKGGYGPAPTGYQPAYQQPQQQQQHQGYQQQQQQGQWQQQQQQPIAQLLNVLGGLANLGNNTGYMPY